MRIQLCLALFFTCFSSATHSQIQDRQPSVSDDASEQAGKNTAVRELYENSMALPDGIAFSALADMLVSLNEHDPTLTHQWLNDEFGLSQPISMQLIMDLESTNKEIEAGIQQVTEKIGCIDGAARVHGEDTYIAFEQIEEAREAIKEEYYLQFVSGLDADTADRFAELLNSTKPQVRHKKYDHKELSRQSGRDGDKRLDRMCRLFESEARSRSGRS